MARRTQRPPAICAYLGDEVVADNFAGGGGASLGIELALGRSPDLAVNHDAEAIAMHAANHPTTRHYRESVWEVDPIAACQGKSCALAWFSPDCKHHSKAKGGKPRDQKIRGLAWVAITWAHRVKPRVIALENVEEFREWGPLHRTGERAGKPIAARKGETFRAFVRKLERLGYVVEHRLLRACDYGAPTTRRRLFLIARCDGRPIVWPAPTHGKGGELLGLKPYRTAAECIDWSIPCPSVFERDRPLADKTLARIARGIRKFVLGAGRPFLVPVNHGGPGRKDHRVHDIDAPAPTITGQCRGSHALVSPVIVKAKTHGGGGNDAMAADEPLRTITASKRGEFAVAVPYLVHRSNGERPGQAPRIYDPQRPLGTVVAQGNKHALCTAFIAKHYGGNEGSGTSPTAPVDTITTQDHHAVVATHLIKFQGTSEQHLNASASGMDEPVPAITAQGGKLAQVAAFLVRYNGTGDAEPIDQPAGTLTTKPRFGLATVTIDGELYTIVDIGMRMLTPRELFLCQGFPPDYKINLVGPRGKKLTATAQIRMCGNSVCPPVAAAIVRANVGAAARAA
jgi:DNA (cytosine-5)-methyltransferase 1